jgi:hypothetical protein
MMRSVTFKEFGAFKIILSSQEGEITSRAAHMLYFCRNMKSAEEPLQTLESDAHERRFLQHIREANVCNCEKYIENPGGDRESAKLKKFQSEYEHDREKIHESKIECPIAAGIGESANAAIWKILRK